LSISKQEGKKNKKLNPESKNSFLQGKLTLLKGSNSNFLKCQNKQIEKALEYKSWH